ncbi:MAG: hypothetical protein K2X86_14615 [Cytophagaceae bacterium]|nr:hypothetical protein [Cytophagaceae bacterium]
MRNVKKIIENSFLFFMLIIMSFTVVSCFEKDEVAPVTPEETTPDRENSFAIDGDGYNNQYVVLLLHDSSYNQFPQNDWEFAYAKYDSGATHTASGALNNLGDSSIAHMGILFAGNEVGVYNLGNIDSANNITLSISGNSVNAAGGYYLSHSGTITVTKYENAGGLIEGVFSGTFGKYSGQTTTPSDTVTITNGKFSLVRLPDDFIFPED